MVQGLEYYAESHLNEWSQSKLIRSDLFGFKPTFDRLLENELRLLCPEYRTFLWTMMYKDGQVAATVSMSWISDWWLNEIPNLVTVLAAEFLCPEYRTGFWTLLVSCTASSRNCFYVLNIGLCFEQLSSCRSLPKQAVSFYVLNIGLYFEPRAIFLPRLH